MQDIVKIPEIGDEKKGNLSNIWVYKFKMVNQLYLLAYEWDTESRILVALGVHENFYRNIKRSI